MTDFEEDDKRHPSDLDYVCNSKMFFSIWWRNDPLSPPFPLGSVSPSRCGDPVPFPSSFLFITAIVAADVMQPLERTRSAPERRSHLVSSRAPIRIVCACPLSGFNHSNAAYGALMGFTAWVCCRPVNDNMSAVSQQDSWQPGRRRAAAMNTEQAAQRRAALICWTVI